MKIAVLLKGIFFMPVYMRKNRVVDFRLSQPSFENFFSNHEVDYYISTYENDMHQSILSTYKPVAYEFRPYFDSPQVFTANNWSILKVLDLFKKNKKRDYDFIIVTRPDITFKADIKFEDLKLPINPNVLMITKLYKHRLGFFEDNFTIVGANVMEDYINVIRTSMKKSHHSVLRRFEERIKKVYLYNFRDFRVCPGQTSFYSLIKILTSTVQVSPTTEHKISNISNKVY